MSQPESNPTPSPAPFAPTTQLKVWMCHCLLLYITVNLSTCIYVPVWLLWFFDIIVLHHCRISIRWTSFPSFLRPGVISSSTDSTCISGRRLFSHLFGTQPSPLRYLLVIGFIVILLLGFLLFMSDSSWYRSRTRRFTYHDFYEHGADSNYHYGIVIDCGSSGSRVFIYYWPPHNGNPDELLQIKQMVDSRGNPVRMKIKPGKCLLSFTVSTRSSQIQL